jgi:hypothetical protein
MKVSSTNDTLYIKFISLNFYDQSLYVIFNNKRNRKNRITLSSFFNNSIDFSF